MKKLNPSTFFKKPKTSGREKSKKNNDVNKTKYSEKREISRAKKYAKKVETTKDKIQRDKYIEKVKSKKWYKLLGYKTLPEFLKFVLPKVLKDSQVKRYYNYYEMAEIIPFDSSKYKEYLFRDFVPYINDQVTLANLWDKANAYAGEGPLKVEHVERSVLHYKKHSLLQQASKKERNIYKSIFALPTSLRKSVIKNISAMR